MQRKVKILSSVILIISLSALFAGCGDYNAPLTKNDFYLDTAVSVTLYDGKDNTILNGAMEICAFYEDIFSPTRPESELVRLNASAGIPFEASSELADVVRTALEYGQLTEGAFDISVGPVSSLYDFKGESPVPPSDSEIKEALSHVDYRMISVDGNTITMPAGMSLTLGGIAKGYIADRIKEYLIENGVSSAIIDLGGNILTIGKRPDGKPFRIGIRDPESSNRNNVLGIIDCTDISVVTSGNYERSFTYEGKLYHHILDPKTGYPADNSLLSVTVTAESSVDADALSTSLFVMGYEKACEFLNDMPGINAVFVFDDGSVITTDGVSYSSLC